MKRAVFYFGRSDYVSVNTEWLIIRRNRDGQIKNVEMDEGAEQFLKYVNFALVQYIVHEDIPIRAKEEAKA